MNRLRAIGMLLSGPGCVESQRPLQSHAFTLFEELNSMAKKCDVCGKTPVFGNRISHAHNVSSRRWLPNLQNVRVKVGNTVRRINVCTRCIRSGKIKKASR
jgi:large subunit ribosomal protein L28